MTFTWMTAYGVCGVVRLDPNTPLHGEGGLGCWLGGGKAEFSAGDQLGKELERKALCLGPLRDSVFTGSVVWGRPSAFHPGAGVREDQ